MAGGGWRIKVGARRCRDRGFRADASPTRPYPRQPGGFSGLREDGHESHLIMQWGLVRTVVRSDGLPAKDRTSLAPLTAPQAPESPQRSESGFNFADTSSVIPGMESSQHVGQLKVGVGVRGFEADFGNAKRTPDGRSPITMPHPVDDQTTPGGRTTKTSDCFAHHLDCNRIRLKCLRYGCLLIPNNRVMLR